MITTNYYNKFISIARDELYEILASVINGDDFKLINDRLIHCSRDLYEMALMFKGQEEGEE